MLIYQVVILLQKLKNTYAAMIPFHEYISCGCYLAGPRRKPSEAK